MDNIATETAHPADDGESPEVTAPLLEQGPQNAPGGPGSLFMVATPIGNVLDMSPRARQVLESADLVLAAHCSSAGNSGCAYAASRASTIIMNRRRNRRCSNAWPEARTWHLSPTRARPSLRIPVTGSPGQPGKKASPFIPYQVLQLRSRLFQQPASLRCHTRSSDLCPGTGRAGKNSFQPSLRCREPWSSLNARTD